MATNLYENADYIKLNAALELIWKDSIKIKGIRFPNYKKMPHSKQEDWEKSILQYGKSCGCQTGAVTALIVTALYIVGVYSSLIRFTSFTTTNYWLSLAIFMIAAIAGKFAGLMAAKRKVIKVRNEILRIMVEQIMKN